MTTVFISHSVRDRAFVEGELIELLHRHGVGTWHMETDIKSAAEWVETILRALEKCDWFLVVLSPRSVASDWVKDEVHWAVAHRPGRIITVLLEDCNVYELHIRLPRIQHIDFRQDLDTARQRLLDIWQISLRPAPHTEMQLLVGRHSVCRYQNGRLVPCQYHGDRMEVRLYEKAGYDGEVDLSATHMRLTPHPLLLDLLARMCMKTQVAGHWGLMKGHRDWIAGGLHDSLARRLARGQGRIRVLQCGIAGLVHYFANLAILLEQLDLMSASGHVSPSVSLATRDLCPGSTRPIQVLLEQLDAVRDELADARAARRFIEPFHYIDVDGCAIAIDESLWRLANRVDLLDARVEHALAIEDLSSDSWVDRSRVHYDVVMSHHLFSMWDNEMAKVERFCKNLSRRTGPGSDLFFAMCINRNDPNRLALSDYHDIFAEWGFTVTDEQVVWDVYDLDHQTINNMLLQRRDIDVVKDTVLVHYVKRS